MRVFTFIVAILAAAMLSLFAYGFGPGSILNSDIQGVPIWAMCTVLSVGLTVVAVGQLRRRPARHPRVI